MDLKDMNLRDLADKVPNILLQSKSQNTIKAYSTAFKKWRTWAQQFSEVQILPANETHVALFMVGLIQNGDSYDSIKNSFYGVKWFHKLGNWNDPCESNLCVNILEACKRISKKPVKKKEPLTVADLEKIADLNRHSENSFLDLRNFCFVLLNFAGFLRFSEVSVLKLKDITFYETHMVVFIEKSKTDVYRDGNRIYIAKTGTKLCPVTTLEQYIRKAELTLEDEYIFRNVSYWKSKKDYRLRKGNSPVTYSSMRDNLKKTLGKIGKDVTEFSLHSLRSGGATAAANRGVKDRLFKRHGRWKTETIKDGYVKDNLHALLSVSLNLGL